MYVYSTHGSFWFRIYIKKIRLVKRKGNDRIFFPFPNGAQLKKKKKKKKGEKNNTRGKKKLRLLIKKKRKGFEG